VTLLSYILLHSLLIENLNHTFQLLNSEIVVVLLVLTFKYLKLCIKLQKKLKDNASGIIAKSNIK